MNRNETQLEYVTRINSGEYIKTFGDKLMTRKTLQELADQVDINKKIQELTTMDLKRTTSIFSLSKKINDMKFQRIWSNRNSKDVQVLLLTLEVDCKWFHSDVFIAHSEELESKLKRIGFEEIDPQTDSSKILKRFGKILHNVEYNIALHLIEEKYMFILDMALTIVEGSSSGFHTDMAVFISSLSALSKRL